MKKELEQAEKPILVHGGGAAAQVTALALAAARLPVCIVASANGSTNASTNASDNNSGNISDRTSGKTSADKRADYQSVLALSPAAKTMLETLGVWARLDLPAAPVTDMTVYGDAHAWAHGSGLDFATPQQAQQDNQNQGDSDITVLAHIVCRAALGRAIAATCDAAVKDGAVEVGDSALSSFDTATGDAAFADGSALQAALLVDCARADSGTTPWRAARAARPLRHDYQADALVCTVESTRPHGGAAVQIFLPTGTLALLPLPVANQCALIWSLPRARAAALATVEASVFEHELAQATQNHAGGLRLCDSAASGARAVQPLSLALAEHYVSDKLCLLGEAAHVIHPLAGQGFNLSLRDAAQLADALYGARALGLAPDGPHVLDGYQKLRRADSGVMAATTHMLATLFAGRPSHLTGPLARAGLSLSGRLASRNPKLAAAFRARANGSGGAGSAGGADGGAHAQPRLMRGRSF